MQSGLTPRDAKEVEAMGVLSVVCPNCRSRLSVQDVPGIQDKILACPICKYKAKVSLYQMGQAGKGGQGASDEATRLPGSFGQQVKTDTGQIECCRLARYANCVWAARYLDGLPSRVLPTFR